MFLDKGQGKSDFLRKKEENKKRKLEKEEGRATSLKIQKNVRAFLSRHRLIAVAK